MITVIYGGSGSGKSEYAESVAIAQPRKPLYYIATMQPFDKESLKKIDRHKQMRKDKNFDTIECYTDLSSVQVKKGATLLLECMSNLVANEIFSESGAKENALQEIKKGIEVLHDQIGHMIIVTNNVFDDGIEYDEETRNYLMTLAKINYFITEIADTVVEVVHGIPITIKNNLEGL